MENKKLNVKDFNSSVLSKKEQKIIRGGDDSNTPIDTITGDPSRGNGKGSN